MTTYRVTGMTCGGCERSVVAVLTRKLPGVKVEASHATSEVKVDGPHDPGQVKAAVEGAGYTFEGAA